MTSYGKSEDSNKNKKPKRKGGRGGMFGRRGGFGAQRNPISSLLYGIISAAIICFLLYLFYTLVITGDAFPESEAIKVFVNVFEWGLGIAKGIGNFIINLFSGGGPMEIAPGAGEDLNESSVPNV